MTVRSLTKTAEKYVMDNLPTFISAVAVTGTLTTAYLTGKATFKAAEIIRDAEEKLELAELTQDTKLTKSDKAKLVWKEYIPPAIAVVGTIGCIVTANSISASRLAGMAAAYKLTEKQYDEYKDKVKEKLGIQDEKRMRDELDQDLVEKDPPPAALEALLSEGEVLVKEKWTGRYFRSEMHTLKAAENSISRDLIHDSYATLSDFYDLIGLERTQESGEVGWSLENPISLDFSTALYKDRPILVMEYAQLPTAIRNYIPMYRGGERCSEDARRPQDY